MFNPLEKIGDIVHTVESAPRTVVTEVHNILHPNQPHHPDNDAEKKSKETEAASTSQIHIQSPKSSESSIKIIEHREECHERKEQREECHERKVHVETEYQKEFKVVREHGFCEKSKEYKKHEDKECKESKERLDSDGEWEKCGMEQKEQHKGKSTLRSDCKKSTYECKDAEKSHTNKEVTFDLPDINSPRCKSVLTREVACDAIEDLSHVRSDRISHRYSEIPYGECRDPSHFRFAKETCSSESLSYGRSGEVYHGRYRDTTHYRCSECHRPICHDMSNTNYLECRDVAHSSARKDLEVSQSTTRSEEISEEITSETRHAHSKKDKNKYPEYLFVRFTILATILDAVNAMYEKLYTFSPFIARQVKGLFDLNVEIVNFFGKPLVMLNEYAFIWSLSTIEFIYRMYSIPIKSFFNLAVEYTRVIYAPILNILCPKCDDCLGKHALRNVLD